MDASLTKYFCINSDPTTLKNVADVWLATALANRVLPAIKYQNYYGQINKI